ncbi:MAG: hypothetical protein ACFB4J_17305 [Elainellaceae cyanobacterium]
MSSSTIANLFQSLVKAGAIPGRDVSVGPNSASLQMNERGYAILQERHPNLAWQQVMVAENPAKTAMAALHHRLGLDFTARLLELIMVQFNQLTEPQLVWYLQEMLGGVEERTGIALYDLLLQRLSPVEQVRVRYLLQYSTVAEPCSEWISDLVVAAGGDRADCYVDGDTVMVSEDGLRLLALVWVGAYDLYEQLAQRY